MDYITSKVFVIAVGILVTLTIVTGVIFVLSNVNEIFNAVENTNTSIYDQYDNIYSTYSGATLNTVGLLNTLRKYEEEDGMHILVSFNIGEEATEYTNKTELIQNIESETGLIFQGIIGYETLYDVSVREENLDIYITFTRK